MEERAPPRAAVSESSLRTRGRIAIPFVFATGVVLLAVSAAVFAAGNFVVTNPTPESIANNANLQNVVSPVLWNVGMLLILVGVFGAAATFGTRDPLARILLWIVALIAVLLILTGGATLFK